MGIDDTRNLYLQPNEFAANANHDQSNPVDLVKSAVRHHPFQPLLPYCAPALLKDRRLAAWAKDRSVMLMSDMAMQRLWLRESRAHAEDMHVALWHKQVHEDREEFEIAMITQEVLRREQYFHDVAKLLRTREKGTVKAQRMHHLFLTHIREWSLNNHIKINAHTIHRIKAGLEMRAKSLAWRFDNLYVESAIHTLTKVKHGGHHVERVAGDIMWQMRAATTQHFHEWRQSNLFVKTPTHGLVRIKHGGMPIESIIGDISGHARHDITKQHHEWRIDHDYVALPSGGFAQVHHMPGKNPERVTAEVQWRKDDSNHMLTRHWHAMNSEVTTPNAGLIHVESRGQMPEATAAALFLPIIQERKKEALASQDSLQLLQTPNGGMIHSNRGLVRGQMPELVAAELNRPKLQKIRKGYDDWHSSHLSAPTSNHGIAPLKGHGRSIEHVAAQFADRPKQVTVAAFDKWHKTHVFASSANHQLMPVTILGGTFEKVSADVSSRAKDLMAEGLKLQDADDFKAEKALKEREKRRTRRHDITTIQKSLAAHEQVVSRLQANVLHEVHEEKVHEAISHSLKIAAYAPKKTGR